MPDSQEVKEMVIAALQTVAEKTRVLAQHARVGAVAVAGVTVEGSRQAARVAAAGASRGAEAAAEGARRGAIVTVEVTRVLGRTREMVPVLQSYVIAAFQALEELKNSEALQLKRIEDLPNLAEYLSTLSDHLDALRSELCVMPTPAVIAAAVIVLRLVSALNGVGDAMLREMLYTRTIFSRIGLCTFALPGWVAVYHWRNELQKGLHRPAAVVDPDDKECSSGEETLMTQLQWYTQLARNAARMPLAFWLSTTVSGAIVLQVANEMLSRVIRRAFRARISMILGAALAYVVFREGGKAPSQAISELVERLPQEYARVLRALWAQVHAGTQRFSVQAAAAAAVGVERFRAFVQSSSSSGEDGGRGHRLFGVSGAGGGAAAAAAEAAEAAVSEVELGWRSDASASAAPDVPPVFEGQSEAAAEAAASGAKVSPSPSDSD